MSQHCFSSKETKQARIQRCSHYQCSTIQRVDGHFNLSSVIKPGFNRTGVFLSVHKNHLTGLPASNFFFSEREMLGVANNIGAKMYRRQTKNGRFLDREKSKKRSTVFASRVFSLFKNKDTMGLQL